MQQKICTHTQSINVLLDSNRKYVCVSIYVYVYVTGFGKIGLNAANKFFQYPRVKPYGSIFFEKNFMAEMDRHQLALAYDVL